MIGGYIVKVAEEHSTCYDCIDKLIQPASNSPLFKLIKSQDNGGLKYPSKLLVLLLVAVAEFTKLALQNQPENRVLAVAVQTILPYFAKPLICNCGDANLPKLLLEKFLRPLLYNHARDVSDTLKIKKPLNYVPLSRKIHKV